MEIEIIHAFWARDFLSLHYSFSLQASFSFFCHDSWWKRLWQQCVLSRAVNAGCTGEAGAAPLWLQGLWAAWQSAVGLLLPGRNFPALLKAQNKALLDREWSPLKI